MLCSEIETTTIRDSPRKIRLEISNRVLEDITSCIRVFIDNSYLATCKSIEETTLADIWASDDEDIRDFHIPRV